MSGLAPQKRQRLPDPGLLLAGLTAAAVFFAGLALDVGVLRLLAKPLPALVLATWVVRAGAAGIGRLVAAGLTLSALGDLLLELGRFEPGLFAFLGAHLAYTAGFVIAQARPAPLLALPFLAFGGGVFLALRAGLGSLTLPVGAYVAVICTMMWRAAARIDAGTASRAGWLGLAGALAFAASDTLIAFDRFGGGIEGVRVPVMALYWLGQWGIAASVRTAAK